MTRKETLHKTLQTLEARGVVEDYITSTPDGKTRWNLWGPWGHEVFTTREAEAFAAGALAGIEHGHEIRPLCNEYRCVRYVADPDQDLCGVHLGIEDDFGDRVDEAYERRYK